MEVVSFSAPEVLNRCLTCPEGTGGVRTGLVAGYWVRKMEWRPSRRAQPALERGAGHAGPVCRPSQASFPEHRATSAWGRPLERTLWSLCFSSPNSTANQ